MLIAVDFDGTIVSSDRPYADVTTPLVLLPGAKEGLLSLKRAGHTLMLYSARTNRSLLFTPEWDPMVRKGLRKPHLPTWAGTKDLNWARLFQMLNFVNTTLAGIFDVVDDGLQGKPLADLFIDDRALRYGFGADAVGWNGISLLYGQPPSLAKEPRHV